MLHLLRDRSIHGLLPLRVFGMTQATRRACSRNWLLLQGFQMSNICFRVSGHPLCFQNPLCLSTSQSWACCHPILQNLCNSSSKALKRPFLAPFLSSKWHQAGGLCVPSSPAVSSNSRLFRARLEQQFHFIELSWEAACYDYHFLSDCGGGDVDHHFLKKYSTYSA